MRFGQGPQAAPGGFRLPFQVDELRIVGVLAIHPGGTLLHEGGVHVGGTDRNPTHGTPVLIDGLDRYPCLLAVGQGAQGLFRLGAVGLRFLGGVDLGQPDLDLALVGDQEREGVTVADADHAAREDVGEGGREGDEEQEQEQEGDKAAGCGMASAGRGICPVRNGLNRADLPPQTCGTG